jgi:hypothetical protein
MPQDVPQAFTLRPKNPTPPFVWLAEAELSYIKECGGGAYEIAAWLGLVRRANSKRSSEFRSRIRDLAKLMGCKYRKAGPLLDWLENIGLLRITRSTDANGSFYRLGTVCRSGSASLRHAVPMSSAQPAHVASASHADSLQEEGSRKTLQEVGEAAASRRVSATHAPRQPAGIQSALQEIEPMPEEIQKNLAQLADRSIWECVRFVATSTFHGKLTPTLSELVSTVPENDLCQICAYVYSKGNCQKPAWSPDQRAMALTARLKSVQPAEATPQSSPPSKGTSCEAA